MCYLARPLRRIDVHACSINLGPGLAFIQCPSYLIVRRWWI
jgi:hypothetical protein